MGGNGQKLAACLAAWGGVLWDKSIKKEVSHEKQTCSTLFLSQQY